MIMSNNSYPSINPHIQGKPKSKCVETAVTKVSTIHGENARRNTIKESLFKAAGSSPNPARRRITVRAIFLQNC